MAQNQYELTPAHDAAPTSQQAAVLHRNHSLDRALIALVLVASSGLSVAMFLLRTRHIGQPVYFFLNWNLFLAWIPLFAVTIAWLLQGSAQRPRLRTVPFLALWLLFFPNAPYLLTDLIHLTPRNGVPLWYDLFMLLFYAWNGLILGFVSLWMVQALITRWFGFTAGWIGAASAIALGAFGIYLGRFQRWNSWDVFTQPLTLARQLITGLLNPADHVSAIAITLMLGGVLSAMYLTLVLLSRAPWRRSTGDQ